MIKLKTEVLRDMLNKAVKVCSFNKMLPLTGLVEMETNAEGLFLKTTDGITTMVIKEKIEGLEPARVTVDANIITALGLSFIWLRTYLLSSYPTKPAEDPISLLIELDSEYSDISNFITFCFDNRFP